MGTMETVAKVGKFAGIAGEMAAGPSQIKENVVNALEEKMDAAEEAARRTLKRGRRAAEDLLDDATYEVKRHPMRSVGVTFGIGLAVGLAVGWLAGHHKS